MLSNIMLNELDKELEARGLHFVRYADDCVIAVGSSAAANRVMATETKWIERKLCLKVNATKTKVTRPKQAEILRLWFCENGRQMAGKTARRFPCKAQKNTEKADKPFLGNQYGRKNPKAELGNPRMDKLLRKIQSICNERNITIYRAKTDKMGNV